MNLLRTILRLGLFIKNKHILQQSLTAILITGFKDGDILQIAGVS